MRIARSTAELCLLLAGLQWAYMFVVLGYAKWGIFGGALALLFSAPLFPVAPFTAWLFFPSEQMWWFYGLLGVAAACTLIFALTRTVIRDESGRVL